MQSFPSISYLGNNVRPHPLSEHVSKASDAHFLATWPFLNDSERQYISDCKYGLFACLCFPDVLSERLKTCCEILTLLFIIDDFLDAKNKAEGVTLAKRIIGVLGGTMEVETPMENLALDIFHDLKMFDQYQAHVIYYWIVNLLSNSDFKRDAYTNVYDYLPFRRLNSGWFFITSVLRFGLDIAPVYYDIQAQECDIYSGNYCVLINDIVSYDREVHEGGESANAVGIVITNEGLSPAEAKEKVYKIASEFRTLYYLARDRYIASETYSKEGTRFVKALEWIMSGNECWSTLTGKYKVEQPIKQ